MGQKASGSWALRAIDKITIDKIKSSYPSSSVSIAANEESYIVWMTAIIVSYLTSQFPDQKTNWDLVVEKARKWIRKEEKRLGATTPMDWESEATKFLSKN